MIPLHSLLIEFLKSHFESNMLFEQSQQNVWIMAASLIPFKQDPNLLSKCDEAPTHTVRITLRTTDEVGTQGYVDGTDIYVRLDNTNWTIQFSWEDLWAEGPPIFHGGTIPDALQWVHELAEPFYVQLKDPFLTSDQRIALNGHDEDYLEPAHEQRSETNSAKHLTNDDFDGFF